MRLELTGKGRAHREPSTRRRERRRSGRVVLVKVLLGLMSGEDGAEGDPSSRIASENRNAVALFRSRGLNIPRNSGRAGWPMPMWSNSPKLSFPHQRQHVPHPGLRWRWRGRRRNGCPRPHPPNGGDRPDQLPCGAYAPMSRRMSIWSSHTTPGKVPPEARGPPRAAAAKPRGNRG